MQAAADELSFVEQALSQTKLSEVLLNTGTRTTEVVKKEEASGVTKFALPLR